MLLARNFQYQDFLCNLFHSLEIFIRFFENRQEVAEYFCLFLIKTKSVTETNGDLPSKFKFLLAKYFANHPDCLKKDLLGIHTVGSYSFF